MYLLQERYYSQKDENFTHYATMKVERIEKLISGIKMPIPHH